MRNISEKSFALILLAGLLVLFIVISLASAGAYGGADNYIHYRLSRYAFQHPQFFIDHWGKPLFTILSSPFSQFGFQGIKIFNVIAGILAAWFTYLTARELKYSNAWLTIFFCCFAPVYAPMMMTGMTEILFSLVLIFSVWLFLKEKYFVSAVVISFLPFARTEGFYIIPVFLLALLAVKKFKAIPFLVLGTVLFSIIGLFYYHDLFWVLNQNPYHGKNNLYGSGSLFTFVNSYKDIIGLLPVFLLCAGILILVYQALKKNPLTDKSAQLEWLLIFFPFLIYLAMHSFLWWKGLAGSLGLVRYMAAIIPLTTLLCLKGVNLFLAPLQNFQKGIFKNLLVLLLLYFIVREPFRQKSIPAKLSWTDELVKETSDWLKNSEYYKNKIYYYDPLFYVYLEISPYDTARIQELIPDRERPEYGIPEGGIVLWDAHFSANEGRLPLQAMMENKYFSTVKVFRPQEKFQVLGGYDYEIYVFQKQTADTLK